MEERLEEGTKIYHKSNTYEIYGEVVGLAAYTMSIMGITYIIKITNVIGKIDYTYSCIVLPRVMFTIES
jgi:hypothetical protein